MKRKFAIVQAVIQPSLALGAQNQSLA